MAEKNAYCSCLILLKSLFFSASPPQPADKPEPALEKPTEVPIDKHLFWFMKRNERIHSKFELAPSTSKDLHEGSMANSITNFRPGVALSQADTRISDPYFKSKIARAEYCNDRNSELKPKRLNFS